MPGNKSIPQGAATSVYCAVAPDIVPGGFYDNCAPAAASPVRDSGEPSLLVWLTCRYAVVLVLECVLVYVFACACVCARVCVMRTAVCNRRLGCGAAVGAVGAPYHPLTVVLPPPPQHAYTSSWWTWFRCIFDWTRKIKGAHRSFFSLDELLRPLRLPSTRCIGTAP